MERERRAQSGACGGGTRTYGGKGTLKTMRPRCATGKLTYFNEGFLESSSRKVGGIRRGSDREPRRGGRTDLASACKSKGFLLLKGGRKFRSEPALNKSEGGGNRCSFLQRASGTRVESQRIGEIREKKVSVRRGECPGSKPMNGDSGLRNQGVAKGTRGGCLRIESMKDQFRENTPSTFAR